MILSPTIDTIPINNPILTQRKINFSTAQEVKVSIIIIVINKSQLTLLTVVFSAQAIFFFKFSMNFINECRNKKFKISRVSSKKNINFEFNFFEEA